jgi:hypothetical protein
LRKPKLDKHLLSAAFNCAFSILASAFNVWKPFLASAPTTVIAFINKISLFYMVFVSYLLKNKLYTHTNDSLERKAGRHVSPKFVKYCVWYLNKTLLAKVNPNTR